MAGSGTLPSISDWLYGSTVSCVTSSGEAITGEVYTFDSASDTVVLRLPNTGSSRLPTMFDYRVLQRKFIQSSHVVRPADPKAPPMPEPSFVDLAELRRKEQKELRKAEAVLRGIGVNVSGRAQSIFNYFANMYTPCDWFEDRIRIGGMGVEIKAPYTVESCQLLFEPTEKNQKILQRIQQMLQGFLQNKDLEL